MNQYLANARKTHDDLTSEIASLSSRKETLAANRKEAFDRREAIRSDRVKATVEGTDFADDGELGRLAEQITVFDEAISVLERQLAERADKQQAAAGVLKFADVEARLNGKVEEHITTVNEIEAAARALASSMKRAGDIASEMATIRHELGAHHEFEVAPVLNRLGGRIARAMTAGGFLGGRMGTLSWTPEPLRPAEEWASEEREVLRRTIEGSIRVAAAPRRPTGAEEARAVIAEDRAKPRYPAVAARG